MKKRFETEEPENIDVQNVQGTANTTAQIVVRGQTNYLPKVSVIIPVYNVEDYLRQCLDSVVNQTLHEIEIICVDDGSTDSSLDILKEYAAKDKRITVLKQENVGSGKSRNLGIDEAKGIYIAFMDSDDFYPQNTTLEKMYQTAEANNVFICGGSLHQVKGDEYISVSSNFDKGYTFEAEGLIKYKDYQFDYGYWRFIYNRQFLKENSLYFPDYLRGEDPVFFIKAMSLAKIFYALKEATYVYRVSHKQVQWTERKAGDMTQSIRDRLLLCRCHDYGNLQNILKKRLNTYYYKNIIIPFINDDICKFLHEIYELDSSFLTEEYLNAIFSYIGRKPARITTNPKVSVIIPIYNVEKYLRECLDSVINQTLEDIEIICVEDGSSDGSAIILEQYAARDGRIKIIKQKNSGLSAARNTGIRHSNGAYIVFIDSDDYIAKDMVEKMYQEMIGRNVDVVTCGIEYFNDDNAKTKTLVKGQKWYDQYQFSGPRLIGVDLKQNFCSTAWCKIYRADIIEKYQIQFPKGLINEDEYWLWAYMIHCRVAFSINEKLYFHRQRADSIMGTRDGTLKMLDIVTIHEKIYTVVRQYKNIKLYRDTLANFFVRNMEDLYKRLPLVYYKPFLQKVTRYAKQNNTNEKIKTFLKFINTKVSVIIPVYNATGYIKECLESLKRQTLHNLEIICVDDGSSDGSLQVLQEFAAQDERFVVLSQKNAGPAAARNNGLQKASGDYIGFVDSDDIISENYFEALLRCALENKADIAATSAVKLFDANGKQSSKNMGFHGKKVIEQVEDKGNVIITTGVSWNKIYRREFLSSAGIKFLELNNAAEDNYFTDVAIIAANKIAVINNAVYYCRINTESQTQVLKDKRQFSMTKVYQKIDEYIINCHYAPAQQAQWMDILNRRKVADFYYFMNTMRPKLRADFRKHFVTVFPYLEKNVAEILDKLKKAPTENKMVAMKLQKKVVSYKLFNFIPICACEKRGGRKTYKILGLPIWKVRKFANNITTKYYLFGLPLMKVSNKNR